MDHAGLDLVDKGEGPTNILGEYRGTEAVVNRVGDREGFIEIVYLDEAEHRTEDLFPGNFVFGPNITDDGRCVIIPVSKPFGLASPDDHLCPLRTRPLDKTFHVPEKEFAHQRPHRHVGLVTGTHADRLGPLDQAVDDLPGHFPLHDGPARG